MLLVEGGKVELLRIEQIILSSLYHGFWYDETGRPIVLVPLQRTMLLVVDPRSRRD